jgi:hypothetical protein
LGEFPFVNSGLAAIKLRENLSTAFLLVAHCVSGPFWGVHRIIFAVVLLAFTRAAFCEVLIVADEFPAMQVVADKLKTQEKIESKLVWQTNLPPTLKDFQAVIVYIHRDLLPAAEDAFIKYANEGGKLVLLHHSISSGKRKNRNWFNFLGVSLPEGDVAQGGYKWIEGVDFQVLDLNPSHYITKNKTTWPEKVASSKANDSVAESLPAFSLHDSEVYINHVHTGPRTILMGLKYTDLKSGTTYTQNTVGWLKQADKGWLIYLMPGHRKEDFQNPTYGEVVVNAVTWKP